MSTRFNDRAAPPATRVNGRIRVPEVRLIDEEGRPQGVVPTSRALAAAQEAGLDLVEVDPRAQPPVCRILDFGKKKFEDKKKAAEAKRSSTVVETKELKLRPKTDDHDIGIKVRHAREFLESGDRVRFTLRFRGREIAHPEVAARQMETVRAALDDVAVVELSPRLDGRAMIMQVAPRPQVAQRAAAAKRAQAG